MYIILEKIKTLILSSESITWKKRGRGIMIILEIHIIIFGLEPPLGDKTFEHECAVVLLFINIYKYSFLFCQNSSINIFIYRKNYKFIKPQEFNFLVFGYWAKQILGRSGDLLILKIKKWNLKKFGRHKKEASVYILFLNVIFSPLKDLSWSLILSTHTGLIYI